MRPHPLLLGALALVTAVAVVTASPGTRQQLPEGTDAGPGHGQGATRQVVLVPGEETELRLTYTHGDASRVRVGVVLAGKVPEKDLADAVEVSVTAGDVSARSSLGDLLQRTDPVWVATLDPGETLPMTIETTPVPGTARRSEPLTYELIMATQPAGTEGGSR